MYLFKSKVLHCYESHCTYSVQCISLKLKGMHPYSYYKTRSEVHVVLLNWNGQIQNVYLHIHVYTCQPPMAISIDHFHQIPLNFACFPWSHNVCQKALITVYVWNWDNSNWKLLCMCFLPFAERNNINYTDWWWSLSPTTLCATVL